MTLQTHLNRKKITPPKTDEEKLLFAEYAYWLKTKRIVPLEVIEKFKADSLRIKNTNPIYDRY